MNPILKAIMFAGFGFMVVTPTKFFLCAASLPLDPVSCVSVSIGMLDAFSSAGFTTHAIQSGLAGVAMYFITGAWKWN